MSDSLWPHRLYSPWNSPGQNTGLSSLSLHQGIFTTQGLNPGLLHYRQILQLSHNWSPRILGCLAYPFSNGSPYPGIQLTLLHCRWILYQPSYQGSPYYNKVKVNCYKLGWGLGVPWSYIILNITSNYLCVCKFLR